MSLTRWEPLDELEAMSARLHRIFNRMPAQTLPPFDGEPAPLAMLEWVPTVDVEETAEEFVITAELSEVRPDGVRVSVDNGIVRIEGERRHEREQHGPAFHRTERGTGAFVRSFKLPPGIDQNRVRAELKDGVLHLRLPKAATARPQAIEVKVG